MVIFVVFLELNSKFSLIAANYSIWYTLLRVAQTIVFAVCYAFRGMIFEEHILI